jgi:PncC family amidohydrolase
MIDPLMIDQRIIADTAALLEACRQRGILLATAESCTGGLLAARLTASPGSSARVLGGVTAYADQAKVDLLGDIGRGEIRRESVRRGLALLASLL